MMDTHFPTYIWLMYIYLSTPWWLQCIHAYAIACRLVSLTIADKLNLCLRFLEFRIVPLLDWLLTTINERSLPREFNPLPVWFNLISPVSCLYQLYHAHIQVDDADIIVVHANNVKHPKLYYPKTSRCGLTRLELRRVLHQSFSFS